MLYRRNCAIEKCPSSLAARFKAPSAAQFLYRLAASTSLYYGESRTAGRKRATQTQRDRHSTDSAEPQ